MPSFKVILMKHRPREDHTYPLALRVISYRRSRYIYLSIHLHPDQWDASEQRVLKGHPNAAYINAYIQQKLLETQRLFLDQEIKKRSTTPAELKKRIKHQRNGITFFQFAQ